MLSMNTRREPGARAGLFFPDAPVDPDKAILDLYRQELRETAANDNRKFRRSRGAEEYLQQSGKL